MKVGDSMMLVPILVGLLVSHATNAFLCDIKGVEVEPIGCYKEDYFNPALPENILSIVENDFQPGDEELEIDSSITARKNAICGCAEVVGGKGYEYFGMQSLTCYSGKNSKQTYNKHGVSKECVKNTVGQRLCSLHTGKYAYGNKYSLFVYRIFRCNVDYKPRGCFKDLGNKPRPVPHYTMNERDRSLSNWNKRFINWQKWNNYFPGFVCRCAEHAKKAGHDVFAIQYYGECWSGKKENSKYNRDGKSDSCIGANFKSCGPGSCQSCVGIRNTNYVYEISA